MAVRWTSRVREKARAFRRETLALYFAIRDPRTPLAARIVAGLVVAYALSPIDLIPDFIPVLGLLDDLILVPLGILLCLRLIPPAVLAEARARAEGSVMRPKSYIAATVIVLAWLVVSVLFCVWFYRQFVAT